jgi:hypothetical protein
MNSADFNTSKKRKLTEITPDEKPLDRAILEAFFVRWITANNQALQLVECPKFRAFFTYLNSNVNVYLTNTHATCGAWVLRQFDIEKDRIRLRLLLARTKIYISCDI